MATGFLVDPFQREIRPWLETDGSIISGGGDNPVAAAVHKATLVRRTLQAKGYDLRKIPVIHRRFHTDRVRYWDLRAGSVNRVDNQGREEVNTQRVHNPGSGEYCACLCSEDWRLATKEEAEAWEEQTKKDRVEYARKKLRYDEAAIRKVSAEASLRQLVDMADVPEESLEELSEQEVAALEARIAALKAKKKTPPKK